MIGLGSAASCLMVQMMEALPFEGSLRTAKLGEDRDNLQSVVQLEERIHSLTCMACLFLNSQSSLGSQSWLKPPKLSLMSLTTFNFVAANL